eukprot:3860242-Pyramimonas_sp.AAC.1
MHASGAGLRGAKSGLFYEVPRLLELTAAFGSKLRWTTARRSAGPSASSLALCARPHSCPAVGPGCAG